MMVVKTRFMFTFRIQYLSHESHLLFFWAIQGSCRVKNSFLGIVEKFRDVLQVFGRALKKNKACWNASLLKTSFQVHLLCMCHALHTRDPIITCNMLQHMPAKGVTEPTLFSHVPSASFNTEFIRQHTKAARQSLV